ncbi:MAG: hypothetical protein KF842_04665 [Caulobacter sp.]|nr:hypothetical protein [Caulobacter sp.]
MRPLLPCLGLTAVMLAACEPTPKGVNGQTLLDEVARVVGDPNTCVLIVEQETGKKTFQYGDPSACIRKLPDCNGGTLNTTDLAELAAKGDDRAISCDSAPEGARTVAWATGPVETSPGSSAGKLAYAAMMEGERALPGREIKARLGPAFRRGGL